MREIKFRAWDTIGKQWLWITGFETAETKRSEGYTLDGVFHDGDYVGKEGIVLMQFAGLKDKNGCDGYHKDIWLYHGVTYTVEWDDENAMFYLKHPSKNATEDDHIPMSEFPNGEIIGNAFENPELLEGRHAYTTDTTTGL